MNNAKRILITGATGFIGRKLSSRLIEAGYEITALSRNPLKTKSLLPDQTTVIEWDPSTSAGWIDSVNSATAIVNLAGENIGTPRWTRAKKQRILQSRLNISKAIISAVEQADPKPKALIQASGIGYYGMRGEEMLDEDSSGGTGFLAEVSTKWEQSIKPIEEHGVRLATIRLAPVLGKTAGLMARLLPPFRFFLGCVPGTGRQWFSWVHIEDVVAVIQLLIENQDTSGIFNLTAPNPLQAKNFYKLLAKLMHRPPPLKIPAFVLRLILGEMADELLMADQRTIPKKLLEKGYTFKYPTPESALTQILS
ncbi:MAG: TIGR01777 family oxidoreductase [Planctomycetota bacterium]|jgi:uncharacterized protein (TIGR01777 family)